VLTEGEKDCVVVFISSKVPSELSSTELLIPGDHEEFADTGLKRTSVIRLDKIATLTVLVVDLRQCDYAYRTLDFPGFY
jgi:hypothetical protein